MNLMLPILCVVFILYGLVLFFTAPRAGMLAGAICVFAGMYAYDTHSFMPLAVGFCLLWVLRLMGLEQR